MWRRVYGAGRQREIKSNGKSKVYHLPGCPNYARLSPTTVVTFVNEEAARHAGYRKAKNCP